MRPRGVALRRSTLVISDNVFAPPFGRERCRRTHAEASSHPPSPTITTTTNITVQDTRMMHSRSCPPDCVPRRGMCVQLPVRPPLSRHGPWGRRARGRGPSEARRRPEPPAARKQKLDPAPVQGTSASSAKANEERNRDRANALSGGGDWPNNSTGIPGRRDFLFLVFAAVEQVTSTRTDRR